MVPETPLQAEIHETQEPSNARKQVLLPPRSQHSYEEEQQAAQLVSSQALTIMEGKSPQKRDSSCLDAESMLTLHDENLKEAHSGTSYMHVH